LSRGCVGGSTSAHGWALGVRWILPTALAGDRVRDPFFVKAKESGKWRASPSKTASSTRTTVSLS
jgi:hypothetical protein